MCFIKSFKDLARAIVAFANYQGGMILLGIEDDEKISGIQRQNIEEWVMEACRTARALATLLLHLRKFDIKRFFALDDYYDGARKAYYSALKSVDPKTIDLTEWLEYFTEGVLLSISKVKDKVLKFALDRHKRDRKGQIALTEKQMKIIEYIQRYGQMSSGDVAKMFTLTRQAALKQLSKLVELEVIKLEGKGRGAHYVIV